MPLTALLLVLAGSLEPVNAPPGSPVRAPSLSAGPSVGALYGLRLVGGGLHGSYGETFPLRERGWTWGWDLGGGLERTFTPAGLAVTDVAVDFALHAGGGPVRLGAGAELRVVDVERRTTTSDALVGFYFDGIAFLSVDVVRFERAAAFLEARVHGLASVATVGQLMAGVRF